MVVKKDVSLEEAVRLFETLPKERFLWTTQSIIDIKNYMGETIFSTVVSRLSSKPLYSVSTFMNGQRNNEARVNTLGTFTMEELREKFPRLFEVTGELTTN